MPRLLVMCKNFCWCYLSYVSQKKLKFAAPLEITKVVVQTREAMELKEKLKSGNAIFNSTLVSGTVV